MFLRLLPPCAADDDALPRPLAERRGNLDAAAAGQVVGRDGVGLQNVVQRAGGDDVPAETARLGPHVDDVVGRAHHLLVVFDHQHRVAGVAQLLEAVNQPLVVALVESDARLVEDVEDVDQLRADLRGQADALALAARERT